MATGTNLYFAKVLELPSTYTGNTVYLVKSATSNLYLDMYVTDNTGQNIYKLPSITTINDQILSGLNHSVFIVTNIADLGNQQPIANVAIAWVLDTTGDPNTNGLPAPYIYVNNGTEATWTCMFNITYLQDNVEWNWILNGPQSSPSAIDQVTNYFQNNQTTLDEIVNGWATLNNTVSVLQDQVTNLTNQLAVLNAVSGIGAYTGKIVDMENFYDSYSNEILECLDFYDSYNNDLLAIINLDSNLLPYSFNDNYPY